MQKEQFDTAREAGEQTLGGAWIRSQTSWHLGAGVDFYEPGLEEGTRFRFNSSHGVDVWTPGRVTLLPELEAAVTGLTTPRVSALFDAAGGFLVTSGTSVTLRDNAGVLQDTQTLPGAS